VLLLAAAVALVALGVSLVWTPLPAVLLAGFAVELVLRELDAHVLGWHTVAYAVGLLLLCELIAWADTLRSRALAAPAVVRGRAASLLFAVVAGGVAAGLAVGAGSVESPNAFVAGVAGAAAVAAIVGVVRSLGQAA
jgi:hypothetical protein